MIHRDVAWEQDELLKSLATNLSPSIMGHEFPPIRLHRCVFLLRGHRHFPLKTETHEKATTSA